VRPLDTRTSEQKEDDAKHGISYVDPDMWKNIPFEVPAHYECADKAFGLVVEPNANNSGYSFTCKRIGPKSSDAPGPQTPAMRERVVSRLPTPVPLYR
jgi:hypothetical protein